MRIIPLAIVTGVFVVLLDAALVLGLLFVYQVNPFTFEMLVNWALCGITAWIGYQLIKLGMGKA
jgi:hypothetical protein